MSAVPNHAAEPGAGPELGLSWTEHGPARALHVSGVITAANAPQLQAVAHAGLYEHESESGALIVDLSDVAPLDAAGVEAVWELLATCGDQVALYLVAPEAAQESLHLAGVPDLLSAHATVEDALAAFTHSEQTPLLHQTLSTQERQLAVQPVIEQAKGMLRQEFDIEEKQAFELLVTLAQDINTPLHILAEDLLTARPEPDVIPAPADNDTVIEQLRARLAGQPAPPAAAPAHIQEPPQAEDPLADDASLVAEFGKLTKTFLGAETVLGVLEQVLAASYRIVPGVALASITLRSSDGTFHTPIETEAVARLLDQAQYDTGHGPCMEVAELTGPDSVRSDDLAQESAWPRFAATATQYGYSSVLSTALATQVTEPSWSGSLNLYGRGPDGMPAHAREVALLLATHASLALAHTEARTESELRQAQLRQAIESRDVIGQAKGILMQRRGYSAEQAFAELKRISQDRNIKLAELATTLATRHTEIELPRSGA